MTKTSSNHLLTIKSFQLNLILPNTFQIQSAKPSSSNPQKKLHQTTTRLRTHPTQISFVIHKISQNHFNVK